MEKKLFAMALACSMMLTGCGGNGGGEAADEEANVPSSEQVEIDDALVDVEPEAEEPDEESDSEDSVEIDNGILFYKNKKQHFSVEMPELDSHHQIGGTFFTEHDESNEEDPYRKFIVAVSYYDEESDADKFDISTVKDRHDIHDGEMFYPKINDLISNQGLTFTEEDYYENGDTLGVSTLNLKNGELSDFIEGSFYLYSEEVCEDFLYIGCTIMTDHGPVLISTIDFSHNKDFANEMMKYVYSMAYSLKS